MGTSVAFVAFILWCCFPIEPKDSLGGSEHLSTQVTLHQSTPLEPSPALQTADAVYDAKYKQLAQSPGCRRTGAVQELVQYEMNT